MKKYRVESGSVFEYSKEQNAYIFVGKLNGRTLKQFIADQENIEEDFDLQYWI